MSPARRRLIESLRDSARRCSAAERESFLETSCGDDQDLRQHVEMLLRDDADPTARMSGTAFGDAIGTFAVQPPDRLGPYKISGLLGTGAMGQVFRATDTRLNREVAVKVANEHFGDRFEREARAISAFNHPHICTLYDVGPNYLVMELLDGITLADQIRKGPLPVEQVCRYGAEIASALAEAHARGIVHRDLKPGNIMVTRHGIKVLDFGLARITTEAAMTETHVVMGTPGYMAPEQLEGSQVDARSDLFALGLIVYEMAAGKRPFPGKSLGRILLERPSAAPPRLSSEQAQIPAALDHLVASLLASDTSMRCQSAAEAASVLSALAEPVAPPPEPGGRSARIFSPVVLASALALLLAIAAGVWFYHRSAGRHWAHEQAIPEIHRLLDASKPLAAYRVLLQAEDKAPGDANLVQVAHTFTRSTSVTSPTAGATVQIQDFLEPSSPWLTLGATPLTNIRVPDGYFRWKLSKPGLGEFISAPVLASSISFSFPPPPGTPPGMVRVPGGSYQDLIGFIGWVNYGLPDFDIDRFEVTNRDYQAFVDQGGYRRRDLWKEKFVKDGQELTWEQAMSLFRDSTGRPGPSTWVAGHFPQGQAAYPVSGLSWYEASAFAAFAGKTLPAIGQFFKTAPNHVARYTINESHFGGNGPLPVGASGGVGPYGTFDMVGNVREWCLNAVGDRRFILGGAWDTQTYQAYDPEALPPFDRSPLNGLRGVHNLAPLPPETAAPVIPFVRDFSKVKPVSDEVFNVYRAMYAYDARPLDPKVEGVVQKTADWTKQKITIDAGYGKERLPVFLFLPNNVRLPFQTVVFFPSARVNTMPDSSNLGDMDFVDYVIQSGRALVYPIYRETYERHAEDAALPGVIGDRELAIEESKEVSRTVDYLATRPDIVDMTKLAYLGVSQGTAYGVIYMALENRFKAAVFLDGGFFAFDPAPGRDQAQFAPRMKQPVLMVNGKYDFSFPPDQAQTPMFEMLGTPAADKSRVVLDTPHDVSQQKPELSRAVLGFLDKYLGQVN